MSLDQIIAATVPGLRGPGYFDVVRNIGAIAGKPVPAGTSDSEIVDLLTEAVTESATTAASVSGDLYPDTATGLAATTDGQFFTVAGSGDTFSILYRNDSGAATEINRFSSKAQVDAAVDLILPAPTGGDDTAMLNTALNAIAAPGARIQARKGATYQISSPLVVRSGTTLDWSGAKLFHIAGTGKNMIVNAAFLAAWTTVTLAWTSGLACTVTWAGHGLAVGDSVWLGSTDQTVGKDGQAVYRGVFRVVSVTDADTFVVNLRRIPAVAPNTTNGTHRAKKADRDIALIGLDADRNYPAANAASVPMDTMAVILAGIDGLTIERCSVRNAQKYCLYLCAVVSADLRQLDFPGTNSDGIKLCGPEHNIRVSGVTGITGDDFVSIDPWSDSDFIGYFIEAGDCTNIRVSEVMASGCGLSAGITVIYSTNKGPVVSGVVFDGVSGYGAANAAVCKVYQDQSELSDVDGSGNALRGLVNDVSFLRVAGQGPYVFDMRRSSVNKLTVQVVQGGRPISATGNFVHLDSLSRVGQANLDDWEVDASGMTAPIAVKLDCNVDQINYRNLWWNAPAGYLFAPTTGNLAVGMVNITGGYVNVGTGAMYSAGTGYVFANIPQFNVIGVSIAGAASGDVFRASQSLQINFEDNTLNLPTGRIVNASTPTSGTATIRLQTRNTNKISGGWITLPAAGVLYQIFSDELSAPVNNAAIARVDGGRINNSQSGIGTIASAGVCDCYGTAANSWRRRGNPLAEQY